MYALAGSRSFVEQDYIIEQLKEKFQCTVLWSEGRACLEYESQEQLDQLMHYVKTTFHKDLLDVFFTAVEKLPADD